jgi:hypothetical protein
LLRQQDLFENSWAGFSCRRDCHYSWPVAWSGGRTDKELLGLENAARYSWGA